MRPASESDRLLLGGLFAQDSWSEAKCLLDASGLAPEDLGDAQIRGAFDLLQRRAQRRQPVDSVSVWTAGRHGGFFADDDLAWLQGLEAANVLTPEQWLQLAEERRSISRRRHLAAVLREVATEAEGAHFSPARALERMDAARMQVLKDYRGNRTAEADPAEMLEQWEARVRAGKPLLTPTHAKPFDETFGGLPPNLSLFVGAPGSLKTGFADALLLSQLNAGMRVGFVGLEDGYRHITRREMARSLGIKVRDIGSAAMVPEQWLKASEEGARLAGLFRNLFVYKWGGIGARELSHLCLSWIVNEGVQCIWVDNATEIDHLKDRRQRGSTREDAYTHAVSDSATALRDLAVNHETPICVLVHTKREYEEQRRNKPPLKSDAADGSAWEKKARGFFGIWRRWSSFRVTSVKVTEDEADKTVEFAVHKEAALVDVHEGALIDLAEEQKREKAQALARKEEADVETGLRKKELRLRMDAVRKTKAMAEAASAPAAKEDAPQLSLLDAPKREEPTP